jgi:SAM-dependent methyltransferase
MIKPTLQCPCNQSIGRTSFEYTSPPIGETPFDLKGSNYFRSYWRCDICRHEFSQHDLDLSDLYSGAYVEKTYGERMRQTFERIVGLPPERSDNVSRVRRVVSFAESRFPSGHIPRLLDIGAGLGVFPFSVKQFGWNVIALDPDPKVGQHLVEVVGVNAIVGDFFTLDPSDLGYFDVITLNKVIEHVEDPVAMLNRAAAMLSPEGFVYVEVPDVAAAAEGPGREEYFIEHHHVFSPISLALCGERANLSLVELERLCEPSGKYTLRGFFTRRYES